MKIQGKNAKVGDKIYSKYYRMRGQVESVSVDTIIARGADGTAFHVIRWSDSYRVVK